MRASLTRMRAWAIPRFSLSTLDLLPAYDGLTSLFISSRTSKSWLYLDIWLWLKATAACEWLVETVGGVTEVKFRAFIGVSLPASQTTLGVNA